MKKKSKKKKISMIIFLLSIPVALIAATQTFAKFVGYAPGLGNPMFRINGLPIYFPFSFITWTSKFGSQAPVANQKASSVLFGVMVFFTFFLFILNKKPQKNTSHGSAEWAIKEDIEEMNLFPTKKEVLKNYQESNTENIYQQNILERNFQASKEKKLAEEEFYEDGVVIGRDEKGRTLLDMGPNHIIVAARTGGGKGISFVLPTLFTWKGSVIVNDIKGENWDLTAAYRKSIGHKVLKFNALALEGSCGYNPMEEIRKGTPYEYQEARNIAEIIISPDKLKDPFFGPSGVNFLAGVILHVLYTKVGKTASLTDVVRFLTSSSFTEEEKLNQMISANHNRDGKENLFEEIYQDVIILDGEERPRVHPTVSRQGADMLGRADKERSGIISTCKTELAIFEDPIVSRNVNHSDFRIRDLMNYKVPVDLYFVTPPKGIQMTAVLMKLLINQIIFILTEEMKIVNGQNRSYIHRLLLMIDEFPAIGKMQLLHDALAYVRGYGMKVCLIIQDLNQLYNTYGEKNSILNNCGTHIYFTPSDELTTKYIETRLDKKTIENKTMSWKGMKYFSDWNYSQSFAGRSLMTFSEIQQMSDDNTLIFNVGHKPIKGIKIRWYEEEKYLNRANRLPKLTKSDVVTMKEGGMPK